ncbi:MAG: hypothetical protein HY749_00445 [Gammaproteobacteria bacterium]|nr:hypothetical protein [Gammaproteobacteria bacterium]
MMLWLGFVAVASVLFFRALSARIEDELVTLGVTVAFAIVLGTAVESGGAIRVLGIKLYCTSVFASLWLILWLPLTIKLLPAIRGGLTPTQSNERSRPTRVLLVALLIGTLPWWDVFYRSARMAWLCPTQGGLRIYKTVEVDGFADGAGIETAHKLGFKYYEGPAIGYVEHWTWDRVPAVEKRPDYEAQYEVLRLGGGTRIGSLFTKHRSWIVRNRETKEVLGELVTINTYPGVVDHLVAGLLGAESVQWSCGAEAPPGKGTFRPSFGYEYSAGDVIQATLKPKK